MDGAGLGFEAEFDRFAFSCAGKGQQHVAADRDILLGVNGRIARISREAAGNIDGAICRSHRAGGIGRVIPAGADIGIAVDRDVALGLHDAIASAVDLQIAVDKDRAAKRLENVDVTGVLEIGVSIDDNAFGRIPGIQADAASQVDFCIAVDDDTAGRAEDAVSAAQAAAVIQVQVASNE